MIFPNCWYFFNAFGPLKPKTDLGKTDKKNDLI
jgi:hypothetical protein